MGCTILSTVRYLYVKISLKTNPSRGTSVSLPVLCVLQGSLNNNFPNSLYGKPNTGEKKWEEGDEDLRNVGGRPPKWTQWAPVRSCDLLGKEHYLFPQTEIWRCGWPAQCHWASECRNPSLLCPLKCCWVSVLWQAALHKDETSNWYWERCKLQEK